MPFLFGDLAYLYGENKFEYMSKNGYDMEREFIEPSTDRTGYDARHGIVRKFHHANAKVILLAPIGNLGFYKGGGIPTAISGVNWELVREIRFGRQDGQWYILVIMWRISTPAMANQAALKIRNYMSLAIDSRMPYKEYMKDQLFPLIFVNKYTNPSNIMKVFGAQLRLSGYGKTEMRQGNLDVISEWSDFADQDLAETAAIVEQNFVNSQIAQALDVSGAIEAFWQDEEDQEMIEAGVVPDTPKRGTKRRFSLTKYGAEFEPAEVPNKRMFQVKPGPSTTDKESRTWKHLKLSMDKRKNKRLEIVNYRRDMDPMDSIFRYFPLLMFNQTVDDL